MSFTRKSLADTIDAYDTDIEKIQQSKRETFVDYREQLAREGRDKDAVKAEIAAFKAAMKRRRAVAKEGEEAVEDQADLVDEIFVEITTARAPRATRVENIEEFPLDDDSAEAVSKRIAALKADPAMSIVDVGEIKKSEPQPAPQAESDLTRSHAPENGQVADNPVAKAADDANSGDATSEVSAVADAPEQADAASRVAGDRAPAATSEDMDATAGETAPKPMYAEPGVITWESCPPEPVARHKWSEAFGDLGQDIEVITEDLQQARAAPIVKMGNRILDGWARYTKARELGIEYPVVQYDGIDDMVDCIKWNVAGRILTNQHKQIIAARLINLYPQRKGIILAVLAGEDIGV